MRALLQACHDHMKDGLHNWILAGTWLVWVAAVFVCKIDTLKEVSFTFLGVFSVVAGAHTAKTVTDTMKNGNGGGPSGPAS